MRERESSVAQKNLKPIPFPPHLFRRYSFLLLITIGLIFSSLTIHELGHLVLGRALYGSGFNVIYDSGFSAHVSIPSGVYPSWTVYAAGGLVSATFILIFFYLPALLSPTIYDTYLEISALLIAFSQALYSWIEVKNFGASWWLYPFILTILLLILVFILYIRKIFSWLLTPHSS